MDRRQAGRALLAVALAQITFAHAAETVSIVGKVVDERGRSIVEQRVEARLRIGRGGRKPKPLGSTKTDAQGRFVFPPLELGKEHWASGIKKSVWIILRR